jgi:SAM-dependent methyltransferase
MGLVTEEATTLTTTGGHATAELTGKCRPGDLRIPEPICTSAEMEQALIEQKRYWQQDQSRRRKPGHPVIEAIYEPRARFLRSLVPDVSQASVLDVGCGTGVMSHYLARNFPTVGAIDFSETMLRENPSACRICGDAARLPFASNSFDIVTASHLLHHLPPTGRLQAVREFGRVARRWVVLYEPNRNNPAMFLFALLKKTERMALAFSRHYLTGLTRAAGLHVETHHVECTILPNKTPLKLLKLARWFDRRPFSRLGFYVLVVARPSSASITMCVEPSARADVSTASRGKEGPVSDVLCS